MASVPTQPSMREYIQALHLTRIANKNNGRGREEETTITTKATTKDFFFFSVLARGANSKQSAPSSSVLPEVNEMFSDTLSNDSKLFSFRRDFVHPD